MVLAASSVFSIAKFIPSRLLIALPSFTPYSPLRAVIADAILLSENSPKSAFLLLSTALIPSRRETVKSALKEGLSLSRTSKFFLIIGLSARTLPGVSLRPGTAS